MEGCDMADERPTQPTSEELLARIEQLEARLQHRRFRFPGVLRTRALSAVIAGAVALGAGGFAFASLPGASSVIHACKGSHGSLRIASACKSGETAVSWNKQGP